ncbi:MAG: MFS transporter [Candidatus Velamenicoccus archaeovorus]
MSVELPRHANVLRSRPTFRRFWVARTISHVGDGAAVVALVLFVKGVGGSGAAVGSLLLAQSLPHLLAPMAGVIADRVDRRAVMIGCDLAQSALFLLLALTTPPLLPTIGLVAVTSSLDTLFGPAGSSAVPALVSRDQLIEANAWNATSLNLQVALGPVLGGVLVAAFGVRWALIANASSFLVSAALLARIPRLAPHRRGEPTGMLADTIEGVRAAWRYRTVRIVMATLLAGVAFAAMVNVALVFLVRDELGGGAVAFGVATAAWGVGMVVGSLAIALRARRLGAVRLLLLAWLLSGLGPLLTGFAPVLAVAMAGQAVGGLGNGIDLVASSTIVQSEMPDRLLGRIFGLVSLAAFAGSSAAYLFGGLLLDASSARITFVVAGLGVLVVWAGASLAFRRARSA